MASLLGLPILDSETTLLVVAVAVKLLQLLNSLNVKLLRNYNHHPPFAPSRDWSLGTSCSGCRLSVGFLVIKLKVCHQHHSIRLTVLLLLPFLILQLFYCKMAPPDNAPLSTASLHARSSAVQIPTSEAMAKALYERVKDVLPGVKDMTAAWSMRQTALNGCLAGANRHKQVTLLLVRVFPGLVGHRVNEEFFEDTPLCLPNETTTKKKSEQPEHMFDTLMWQLLTSARQRGKVEALKRQARKNLKRSRPLVEDDSDDDSETGMLSADAIAAHFTESSSTDSLSEIKEAPIPEKSITLVIAIDGEEITNRGIPHRLSARHIKTLPVKLGSYGELQAFVKLHQTAVTKVAAKDVAKTPDAVDQMADTADAMWHGLLQIPPHCTPLAIKWVEQEARKIDRETRVWLALRDHARKDPSATPLFLHELTAYEYDPLKLPPLQSDEARFLEDRLKGWSSVLADVVELPVADHDYSGGGGGACVDVNLLTSDEAGSEVGADSVRAVLHVLVQADKALGKRPTVYVALTYLLAKLRAQAIIGKSKWKEARIPFEYRTRPELKKLVWAIQVSFAAFPVPVGGQERRFHSVPQPWINLADAASPIAAILPYLSLSEREKRCNEFFLKHRDETST